MKLYYLALSLLVLTTSCASKRGAPTTAATALERYLGNGDGTARWELKESYGLDNDVTAYDLVLTSQKWREHIWKHQLTVLVPNEVVHDGALLFITGGSVAKGEPNF